LTYFARILKSKSSFLAEIDEINSFVYTLINNGVYKAGFATKQYDSNQHLGELHHPINEVFQKVVSDAGLLQFPSAILILPFEEVFDVY
jgi:glutathionyl-hydroquinone reductase